MAARRFVRAALQEASLDELAADAVLLTSELCENAVLHAGTGFELELSIGAGELTVAVTDQGPTALEIHRAMPRPVDDRAAHGRGLLLVDALSAAWGSRHDSSGHRVWFRLRGTGSSDPGPADTGVPPALPSSPTPPAMPAWPDVPTARWLLHLPAQQRAAVPLPVVVGELVRRLCDVLGAGGGCVWVDYGDGDGEEELARHGRPAGGDGSSITVPLPLSTPRAGRMQVVGVGAAPAGHELAELTAQRVALAVEADWIRREDRQQWSWLTYMAEASELLAHSLDVELTAAIVPQIIVPRLGRWCAVHLLDETGVLRLAALTHFDETALPLLRTGLDAAEPGEVHAALHGLLAGGTAAARLRSPSDGVAVSLAARGVPLGTLSVGRRADGPHSPEEIMLISDVARRAAPAIDNARRNASNVAVSQALQEALLPRALPSGGGVEFAAAYLPASAAADVGGDFYDVLPLEEGRWLASVGDVCGKGPRAAARTGLIRDVLRVLVREGHPPAQAIELLNDVMLEADDPDQFATVALAIISRLPVDGPAGLAVDLVLAGHEQPVLLRADGSAELVGRHGTPAGLVNEFAVHPTRHELAPGDALVGYTDGVTERRRGNELFGPDRLKRAIAGATGSSATGLVAAVRQAVDDFTPESQRDDIVILAVRAPG